MLDLPSRLRAGPERPKCPSQGCFSSGRWAIVDFGAEGLPSRNHGPQTYQPTSSRPRPAGTGARRALVRRDAALRLRRHSASCRRSARSFARAHAQRGTSAASYAGSDRAGIPRTRSPTERRAIGRRTCAQESARQRNPTPAARSSGGRVARRAEKVGGFRRFWGGGGHDESRGACSRSARTHSGIPPPTRGPCRRGGRSRQPLRSGVSRACFDAARSGADL